MISLGMSGSWVRAGRMAAVGVAVLALCPTATPQSINLDIDISGGPPSHGHGVPSDLFPGAAGQPGRWNSVGISSGPYELVGLDGIPIPVVMTRSGRGGSATGSCCINTGDYAFLLNDASNIPTSYTYTFSDLLPGLYRAYSYAVNPGGKYVETDVFFPAPAIRSTRL